MQWEIRQTVDLAVMSPQRVTPNCIFAVGDDRAHKWIVRVEENGASADLSGFTAMALVVRPDGKTALVQGSIDGSEAQVLLSADCYARRGHVIARLTLSNGESVVTVAEGRWAVTGEESSVIVDADGAIPTLPELLAEIENMRTATEACEEATEAAVAAAAGGTTAPAIIADASGSVISIADGAARAAQGLVSTIAAVQDGSGDPSPDNVRVISGWDTVSVTRTGRNLLSHLDYETTSGHTATTITEDAIDVTSPTTDDYGRMPVHLKAGVTYTLVIDWEVYGRDASSTDATYLSYRITALETAANQVTVTANGVKRVVKTYTPDVDVSTNLALNPNYGSKLPACSRTRVMLLVGTYTTSTAPAFEPCSRQALAAELPETVWGGTLDWMTGVLTVDKLMLTYDGTEEWARVTSTQGDTYFRVGAVQDKRMAAIRTESSHSKYKFDCSHFLHVTYSLANKPDHSTFMFVGGSGKTLAIIDASFEDVDSWKAYLAEQAAAGTPLTCVFDHGTPYTLQLDPQTLTLLKGDNALWSDCGDTAVAYIADTKLYIDNAVAAIAASVLNE